jgi:hypothetical protein
MRFKQRRPSRQRAHTTRRFGPRVDPILVSLILGFVCCGGVLLVLSLIDWASGLHSSGAAVSFGSIACVLGISVLVRFVSALRRDEADDHDEPRSAR